MSTCEHGFTAFYDCPYCLCPRCEWPMGICDCYASALAEAARSIEDLERAVRAAGEVA